ncbi:MAG: hypothetical protein K2Y29_20150, partial [Beijerinckiaceae bacterium]|nr:hypothetical protein [Beijerinckiaceae bacterium]
MNDEMKPFPGAMGAPPRTSNRGARREPPVIEGEAVRGTEPAPTPTPEAAEAVQEAVQEAAQEAKPTSYGPAKETSTRGAVSSDDLAGPRPAETSSHSASESSSASSSEPPSEVLAAASPADPSPPAHTAPPARGYGLGAVAAASLGSAALAALAVFGLQSFGGSDAAPVAAL